MDLNDLIRDAEEALAKTQDEHRRLQADIAVLGERIGQLNAEIQGLRLAQARREGRTAVPALEEDWGSLSRLAAVLRILAEADGPRSPSAISQLLAQQGRHDPPPLVSASLAHLKRTGKVKQAGYGLWTVPDKGDDQGVSLPIA